MADSGMFFVIVMFMLIFNSLIGVYAISETSIDSDISDMPKIDETPGLLDYLSYPFEWIVWVFELVAFSITGLPTFLAFIVVGIDITLAYILFAMIRGN